ncbi:unnamed protein product [Gordionus sp. m RMFG-2023]
MIGTIDKTITGNVTDITSIIFKDILGKHRELNKTLVKHLCVIIAFGIPGNLLTIFMVISKRLHCQVQQRSRFYFVTLALANILILMVLIPWVVYDSNNYFKSQYTLIFSVWFGKFEWFLEDSIACFIDYLLALMSLDRMLAIAYPFLYSNLFKIGNIKRSVYVILLLSITLSLPFLNYYQVKRILWFHQTNDTTYNTTLNNTERAIPSSIKLSPDHKYLLNIDPIYTYSFNDKMEKFSSIFDKISAVITNLLPCLITLSSNVITAILFYRRSNATSSRIKIPLFRVGLETRFYSRILLRFKEFTISTPKALKISIFLKNSNRANNAETSKQSKLSLQAISRGNQVLPCSVVTSSSLRIDLVKERNRNFTILTGCLSLASVIFSLPWLIFIFQKLPTWEDDFLMSDPNLQFFVYVMMYSQYSIYPYLIILTTPLYRKFLFKHILCPCC